MSAFRSFERPDAASLAIERHHVVAPRRPVLEHKDLAAALITQIKAAHSRCTAGNRRDRNPVSRTPFGQVGFHYLRCWCNVHLTLYGLLKKAVTISSSVSPGTTIRSLRRSARGWSFPKPLAPG